MLTETGRDVSELTVGIVGYGRIGSTLAELLLTRAMLNLAATVAAMLACDGESKLLSEMASLHGYLAAAASICAAVFAVAFTLLIRSGTALS
jgi:phosphoglycerate dehydrogenase-like enzyme